MNRRLAAAAALAAVVMPGMWFLSRPDAVRIEAGDDVQASLRRAPAGAVVELGAGEHLGPLTLGRAMTLRGEPGTVVTAGSDAPAVVTVSADGTIVEDLTTRGGATGVMVREVEDVELRSLTVQGAELHGIEIIDATAHVSGAHVSELRHPLAQGIEIRNSDGRPDSVIEDSTVIGGMEGIVSHVAELAIRDNLVTETTMRGITVTEMSDGWVTGNRVRDVTGAGLYCGDMSRCQFQDNVVTGVAGDSNGRSTAGWGLVVTYHAEASSQNDVLQGVAGPRMASIGGDFRSRSPLERGAGWGALLPASGAIVAALALIGLLYVCASPFARALERGVASEGDRRGPTWLLSLGVLGLGVQTFHMIEHTLQLFRVRVDGIPSRGGIVGPRVEAEWIHFAYNSAVLVGFLLIVLARHSGWRPPGRVQIGDRILLVGVVVQGYHAIEHSTKLAQHLSSGAKVNHGILGGQIDLVLLHFSINLAVYLSGVGACIAYLWGVRLRHRSNRQALSYG